MLRIRRASFFFEQIRTVPFLRRGFSDRVEINPSLLDECEARIFQVLRSAAKCDQSKLSRTATFKELGFDSLDQVELVVAMEENFGFDISNEEAEKISVVADAITIFYKYFAEKANQGSLEVQKEAALSEDPNKK